MSQRPLLFQAVFQQHFDALIMLDAQGVIIDANPSASKLFGYTDAEWSGMRVEMLMPEPHSSSHAKYLSHYLSSGQSNLIGTPRLLPAVRKDKSLFKIELMISEICFKRNYYFLGQIREKQSGVKSLSGYAKDKNTGLMQIGWFEKDLSNWLSKVKTLNRFVVTAIFDIDNAAKAVSQLGRKGADHIIQLVSGRIASRLVSCGSLYHIDMDTLAFISSEMCDNIESAKKCISDIQQNINSIITSSATYGDVSIPVSFSTGFVISSSNSNSVHSIQELLYSAKRQSKINAPGGIAILTDEDKKHIDEALFLKTALQHCVERNELSLVFQPQFSAQKQLCSSEVLLRWNHPERGMISPALFIPLAENTGMITKIGEWVVENVFKIIQSVQAKGIRHRVAINVSSVQFQQKHFSAFLLEQMKKYHIDGDSIILEITETSLVTDYDLVINELSKLRKNGLRISIDDFGTEYSGLSYLKRFPFDEIKIDKQFVDDINDSKHHRGIVNTVLNIAQEMDVQVVAEGVETQTQFDYLKSRGCDIFQGYLLSKPLNEDLWLALISAVEMP